MTGRIRRSRLSSTQGGASSGNGIEVVGEPVNAVRLVESTSRMLFACGVGTTRADEYEYKDVTTDLHGQSNRSVVE
jgi:hypothetical protein